MNDLYRVLGVPPTATVEQIKAAYRRRALRLHPDKNSGDSAAEEQFKRCSDAYATLVDPEKRAEHDARLLAESSPAELVGEILSSLLGERFRRKRPGQDLRRSLALTLEEAALGTSRQLSLTIEQLCNDCGGSGAAPGGAKPCPECRGRGELPREGLLSLPRPCPRCGGQGRRVIEPCRTCGSVGMVELRRELRLTLQGGVEDGDVRVVKGQGESGVGGGAPGDLRVHLAVESHPFFERRGRDIHIEVPISITTAALGGGADVPTLEGQVRMKVPRGTQSGRTFRLRGKGALVGGRRGDLLVRVVVETPADPDSAQRELLERLEGAALPRRRAYEEKLAALLARRTSGCAE